MNKFFLHSNKWTALRILNFKKFKNKREDVKLKGFKKEKCLPESIHSKNKLATIFNNKNI